MQKDGVGGNGGPPPHTRPLPAHDEDEEEAHGSGHQKWLVSAPLSSCVLVSWQASLGLSGASSVGSTPDRWFAYRKR